MEKRKRFIINFMYYGILAGFGYAALKYILPILAPFFLGLAIALLLKPLIMKIHNKTGINRRFLSALILILFYIILFTVIAYLGVSLFFETRELAYRLPDLYKNDIEPGLIGTVDRLVASFPAAEPVIRDFIEGLANSLGEIVRFISSNALNMLSSVAARVSLFFIKFLFMIISSFFFIFDSEKIYSFILRQMSENMKNIITRARENLKNVLSSYTKAYLMLISLTFIELSIGLSLLRIRNAIPLAFVIALIDILPILGTGGVLIPWGLIAIVIGRTGLGLGILLLYLVITVVRQSLEPKIVGDQIGLHPIVILLCIFIGGRLFGVLGIFLIPITMTIIKKLNDEKVIHVFR